MSTPASNIGMEDSKLTERQLERRWPHLMPISLWGNYNSEFAIIFLINISRLVPIHRRCWHEVRYYWKRTKFVHSTSKRCSVLNNIHLLKLWLYDPNYLFLLQVKNGFRVTDMYCIPTDKYLHLLIWVVFLILLNAPSPQPGHTNSKIFTEPHVLTVRKPQKPLRLAGETWFIF